MCIRDRVSTQSTGEFDDGNVQATVISAQMQGDKPHLDALAQRATLIGEKILQGGTLQTTNGTVTREQIEAMGEAILSGKLGPSVKQRIDQIGAAIVAQNNAKESSEISRLGEQLLKRCGR
eukprot:TRINITY_DN16081_c0_g1_i3.p1 TRINITY_DN16081_c0_g1~~TRINITY_DN16081_c0_g1_i3.p1  ORF type:complete len:121 (+),score=29.37 TRINITY_DN16081_c0_g1_i3:137-499(+)